MGGSLTGELVHQATLLRHSEDEEIKEQKEG